MGKIYMEKLKRLLQTGVGLVKAVLRGVKREIEFTSCQTLSNWQKSTLLCLLVLGFGHAGA